MAFFLFHRRRPLRRILLIDPSQKGALPLYTAMIGKCLEEVSLESTVLANRELLYPGIGVQTLKWLPAGRWPKTVDELPDSKWEQALKWILCIATVIGACIYIRPDCVHFQYPFHARLDPFFVRLLSFFVPVVWTAHDVLPHDPGTNDIERARALYRSADAVLVHSRPAAQQIKELAKIQAIVIPHPAMAPTKIPSRSEARRKMGLAAGTRIAAAIGFIRTYKGYDLLANIWCDNESELPTLLLLGELVDSREAAIINRLSSASNTIIRLGYASDDDVVCAISAADIVLLPHSKGSDSGLLHLARAIGRPVLSSDTPQLASVVVETRAGVVLPRDANRWRKVLCGPLPPPPVRAASLQEIGVIHYKIYEKLC